MTFELSVVRAMLRTSRIDTHVDACVRVRMLVVVRRSTATTRARRDVIADAAHRAAARA